MRVYKAIRANHLRKAKSLQKLILKSRAARLLAIRQVTQLNAGKKTPGIDGKASLTHQERLDLSEILKSFANTWKHQRLREIPIPKKDGSTRILKVPTIADRAWQCLVKFAIEPAHEATFHERSYGFRPGRAAHDAQKILFNHLRMEKTNKSSNLTSRRDLKGSFSKGSRLP
jgi:retron-type reverse transcriptase